MRHQPSSIPKGDVGAARAKDHADIEPSGKGEDEPPGMAQAGVNRDMRNGEPQSRDDEGAEQAVWQNEGRGSAGVELTGEMVPVHGADGIGEALNGQVGDGAVDGGHGGRRKETMAAGPL